MSTITRKLSYKNTLKYATIKMFIEQQKVETTKVFISEEKQVNQIVL